VRLYRITPEPYLQVFNGLGASYRDGARWNRPGLPVLYFALSPATALLEMGNYIPSPRLVPPSYRLGIYELADMAPVESLPAEQLPEQWSAYPYPAATQALGSAWLQAGRAVALLVPSAAVPAGLEPIAVVNPLHPACAELRLLDATAELYNRRAFSGIG